MKLLILNAGSSSLKVQLYGLDRGETSHLRCLSKGHIDEIGTKKGNYQEGLHSILRQFQSANLIQDLREIKAVGHRVVHGGENYSRPVLITTKVEREIEKLCELAPLHNPANLEAIRASKKIFPRIPHIAVFDTAFHQTMPPKAYLYALPYSYYQNGGIRRYGFHGTSHAYVSREAGKLLRKKNSRIITCHLGNGSSLTAVKNGISVDTSMGFTPLEGVPMGTRSGDIDPAIIAHLMKTLKLPAEKIFTILNQESGLKGLSGLSSDMRILRKNYSKKRVQITLEVLSYRIAKYIGAYTAAMNGLDALVFTGGLGEKAWYLREKICAYCEYLGLKLDPKKNQAGKTFINKIASKIKVYVIPTDEEKQIALELIQSPYLKARGP